MNNYSESDALNEDNKVRWNMNEFGVKTTGFTHQIPRTTKAIEKGITKSSLATIHRLRNTTIPGIFSSFLLEENNILRLANT